MSSFFSRPSDLDCGGYPRSAGSMYKGKSGTVLWENQRNWIFYDSNGNWFADWDDNPDILYNRDVAEDPLMGLKSALTQQCISNKYNHSEALERIEKNKNRKRSGRRYWPEPEVRISGSRQSQEEIDSRFNFREEGRGSMRMRRGGRSRRNIKKNKSKKRRSRKTIRRRRRR